MPVPKSSTTMRNRNNLPGAKISRTGFGWDYYFIFSSELPHSKGEERREKAKRKYKKRKSKWSED
jgi:hypothetical protein